MLAADWHDRLARRPTIHDLAALLPYLRKHRLSIASSAALLILAEGLGFYATVILRRAVDCLDPDLEARYTIGMYALILLGVVLVQGAVRFGSRYLMGHSSRHVEYDVRNDFFGHLLTLDRPYYVEQNVGDLMSRAINDLNAVRMMLGRTLMFASSSFVRAPIALTVLALINWRLTLITIVPFALLPIVMKRLATKIHSMFEHIQEQFSTMTSKVRDSFTGVRVVRAYVREDDEVRDFGRMNDEFVDRNRHLIRVEAIMFQMIFFLPGMSFLLLLWYGGYGLASERMTFGQFTQFQVVLMMLIFPMASFGFTWAGIQRGAASMGRLNEIMATTPSIMDAPNIPLPEPPIHGSITFRNLRFAYDGPPVLEDVNLHIPAGSTVAIVGGTGSGKSTLINLIPRLQDAEPGMVLVDDRDVREYSLAHLRSHIGYVQQESFLFSETLSDNLRFGDPGADEGALRDVAEVAGLLPEIEDFPRGFSTELGERGLTISGGQRQRTSIARSLVGRPRIVILDDAFASVDIDTEETILGNLRDYLADVTVILISHRVSTVRDADKIIVLKVGRVAEEGTHDELLARGQLYAELAEKQRLREELDTWNNGSGDETSPERRQP